jgi:hypothetical protein
MRARSSSGKEPWLGVIGAEVTWAWVLTNNRGFEDGVQFLFRSSGGTETCIQLEAAASEFRTAIVTDITDR